MAAVFLFLFLYRHQQKHNLLPSDFLLNDTKEISRVIPFHKAFYLLHDTAGVITLRSHNLLSV